MFTDIVAYTVMSEKNEQFALSVLTQNSQIHNTLILKHSGKKLKEIGDGTLAIFVGTSVFGGGLYIIPAATYSVIMYLTSLIFIYFIRNR